MRMLTKTIAILVSCLPAGLSVASPPVSYEVSARLTHADQLLAAPSVTALAGKPASLEVTGADGYRLTFTITDLQADRIRVDARVESSHGSMAPTVVVRPGVPASVSVDDLDLELTVRRGDGDGSAKAVRSGLHGGGPATASRGRILIHEALSP